MANDVLRAVRSLGGEDARGAIINRALDFGAWSAEELDVPALWKKSAHPGHLRSAVDSAVTICGDRGLLERLGSGGVGDSRKRSLAKSDRPIEERPVQ